MRWPRSSSTMARIPARLVSGWVINKDRVEGRLRAGSVCKTGLGLAAGAWVKSVQPGMARATTSTALASSDGRRALCGNVLTAAHARPLPAPPADGMCQEKCPVKINTGELVKQLRSEEMAEGHPRASAVAMVRWAGGPAGISLCNESARCPVDHHPVPPALRSSLSPPLKSRPGELPCRCPDLTRPSSPLPALSPAPSLWPTTSPPPPGPSTSCSTWSARRTACWAPPPSRPSPPRSTAGRATWCPSGTPTCPRCAVAPLCLWVECGAPRGIAATRPGAAAQPTCRPAYERCLPLGLSVARQHPPACGAAACTAHRPRTQPASPCSAPPPLAGRGAAQHEPAQARGPRRARRAPQGRLRARLRHPHHGPRQGRRRDW